MKKSKDNKLIILAYTSLIISILSVFTTIVGYTNRNGVHRSFTLLDFLSNNGNGFDSFVSREYVGKIYWVIRMPTIRIFIFIGITAVICAFIGLSLISKQKENKASFILTLLGLLGTMAPALLIFSCIVVLKDNYLGNISFGLYPIVSPIAMLVCIAAATEMHRKNNEYKKKLKEANGLIFRAGDL